MAGATAPEARTRPLEQLSGVPRMMFAVARVKRAETAFPGLHGAVEVVLTSGWPKTNANRPKNRPNPTWRRHGTSPTPPTRSTSAWAGAREATDSACENAGNAKGRHPKTPARNLERHPYQRVTDTPSTPEPSAVAMRIHGPAATGVYVTPLIAKVICPDLLPVV